MEIKYIDYGLGFRIKDKIYLNKDLLDYSPKLHDRILSHELAHTSGYSYKDIILDIKGGYLHGIKKQYYKFILTHPKSLLQLSPILYIDGMIVHDPVNYVLWFFILLMILMIIIA